MLAFALPSRLDILLDEGNRMAKRVDKPRAFGSAPPSHTPSNVGGASTSQARPRDWQQNCPPLLQTFNHKWLANYHWQKAGRAMDKMGGEKKSKLEAAGPHIFRAIGHLSGEYSRQQRALAASRHHAQGGLTDGTEVDRRDALTNAAKDGLQLTATTMDIPMSIGMTDMQNKLTTVSHGASAIKHAAIAVHHTVLHHGEQAAKGVKAMGACFGAGCSQSDQKRQREKGKGKEKV